MVVALEKWTMNDFNRNTVAFYLAVVVAGTWIILALLGDHPDGALLGFAGTLLLVSGMGRQSSRETQKNEKEQKPYDNEDDNNDDIIDHVGR